MDALISTAALAERLGRDDLVLLDATYVTPDDPRDAAAEFAAAHIPGARFLDLASLKDPTARAPMMLPSAEAFADRLAVLGVRVDSMVVVYDTTPLRTAARAWWMARVFGREVRLLDGGLAKWRAEGRPLESGTPPPVDPAPAPRLTLDAGRVRTLAQVRADLDTPAEQLLDARAAARFTGEEPDIRPGVPSGHIPGARNLPHTRLFEADGTWKRGAALEQAFAAAGVDIDRPITVTCGSGITAATLAFGLHLLGREAALYDGSWSEWALDPDTPKALGPA